MHWTCTGAEYETFQAGGGMGQGNSQKLRQVDAPDPLRVLAAERTIGDRFLVDGLSPPWLGSSDYHVFGLRGMGNSRCGQISRFVVGTQRPVESSKSDLVNRKANVFSHKLGALKYDRKRTSSSQSAIGLAVAMYAAEWVMMAGWRECAPLYFSEGGNFWSLTTLRS